MARFTWNCLRRRQRCPATTVPWTRGVDPFLGIDTSSTVLLRAPVLSVAVAEDDVVKLAAKGTGLTVDLFANDDVSEGETLTLTHLDGGGGQRRRYDDARERRSDYVSREWIA